MRNPMIEWWHLKKFFLIGRSILWHHLLRRDHFIPARPVRRGSVFRFSCSDPCKSLYAYSMSRTGFSF